MKAEGCGVCPAPTFENFSPTTTKKNFSDICKIGMIINILTINRKQNNNKNTENDDKKLYTQFYIATESLIYFFVCERLRKSLKIM